LLAARARGGLVLPRIRAALVASPRIARRLSLRRALRGVCRFAAHCAAFVALPHIARDCGQ
jgi:hypothetical protein